MPAGENLPVALILGREGVDRQARDQVKGCFPVGSKGGQEQGHPLGAAETLRGHVHPGLGLAVGGNVRFLV